MDASSVQAKAAHAATPPEVCFLYRLPEGWNGFKPSGPALCHLQLEAGGQGCRALEPQGMGLMNMEGAMSAGGFKVEICVDSVESAEAAQRGGADRVELCHGLIEGGTTPSAGCIKLARQRLCLGLQIMIRPRGGDFLYSPAELEVMREDIRVAKDLGADGVVLGCLNSQGHVDVQAVGALIQVARPMGVTFHRAFDMCRDPRRALEDLIALGADRVLTSGQESTCWEGAELIAELHRQAAGRIVILPGGGITPRNVIRIVQATGVAEVHLSARRAVASRMEFRQPHCFMGGAFRPDEFSWKTTDEEAVKAAVRALR